MMVIPNLGLSTPNPDKIHIRTEFTLRTLKCLDLRYAPKTNFVTVPLHGSPLKENENQTTIERILMDIERTSPCAKVDREQGKNIKLIQNGRKIRREFERILNGV